MGAVITQATEGGKVDGVQRKIALVGENRIIEITIRETPGAVDPLPKFHVMVEGWGDTAAIRFGVYTLGEAWDAAFATARRIIMGEFDGS